MCYDFGKGVEKDKSKAAQWYRKAAEQGNEAAQKRLDKLWG
jgi:TPR repeat protein